MLKKILYLCVAAVISFTQCSSSEATKPEQKPKVKNIILMIGDGMGVAQAYAGLTANKGSLNLERCQFVGFSKTYSANDYVTDSAAGGTAIACGTKTNNGVIGLDAKGDTVQSILAYAAKNGLSTGVVVSCELTHATPASFIAHRASRNMVEEIATDFLKANATVCIGGGRNHFEKRKDEQNITEKMKAAGYQIAYTMDEVKNVTSGKLLALLASGHPKRYPERGDMLPEGVQAAINILKSNKNGFFLMVEGSQIDYAGHDNDPEYLVNEMMDFDRAIKVAFDYAAQDPNTLVIITADHETGGLTLNGGDFSTGEIKAAFTTKGHTGVMVPVYAFGAGAEEFAGIYENTQIMPKLLSLYGINR